MEFGKAVKIGAGVTCGGCLTIILVIAGLMAIGQHGIEQAKARREPTTGGSESRTEKPSAKWEYETEDEKMAQGVVKYAKIESINTVNFDFPYQGPQHGRLTLRTHPRWGKDVIFNIEKGQLLCDIVDGASVLVRFDNGKPQTFHATGPADHSTTSLFIRDYGRFVAALKTSKKVYIETKVYQEGNQVFEFSVDGLQW